ncbi:MAG: hypothetical protein GF392_02405 [Candidatus Omnitrophica bacterium]|nr:hypothetical protein [Candidatus Omnitrophota bacterium]
MSIKENFKISIRNWLADIFTVKLIKICFVVWIVLWVVFFFRENKDGEYRDLFALAPKGLEAKRAYLAGEDLYGFLLFSRKVLPPDSTYKLVGLPEFSIREIRSMYYLAPLRTAESGYDHILVYGEKGYTEEGFEKTAEYERDKYILRKNSWN